MSATTAQIRLAGSDDSVDVTVGEDSDRTVADVLAEVLVKQGLPASAIETLKPAVNGEDADMDDKVEAGDIVTADAGVANG